MRGALFCWYILAKADILHICDAGSDDDDAIYNAIGGKLRGHIKRRCRTELSRRTISPAMVYLPVLRCDEQDLTIDHVVPRRHRRAGDVGKPGLLLRSATQRRR